MGRPGHLPPRRYCRRQRWARRPAGEPARGHPVTAWIPELRLARRAVLRAKARSGLGAVMVGMPILGITVLTVLLRTASQSDVQLLPHDIGAAQARITVADATPVRQDADGDNTDVPTDSGPPGKWTDARIATAAGPGSRAIPDTTSEVLYRTADGYATASLRQV